MYHINRDHIDPVKMIDAEPVLAIYDQVKSNALFLIMTSIMIYIFFVSVMDVGDRLSMIVKTDLMLAKAVVHGVFGSWAIILVSTLSVGVCLAMHTQRRAITDKIAYLLLALGLFGYWFVLACGMGQISPDVPSLSVVALLIVVSAPGAWVIYRLPRTLRVRTAEHRLVS